MTFAWRLAGVILVMTVIAWIDWRRHRAHATKWREYAFFWTAGLLGGLIGVLLDNLTARLSPAFFVLEKGISPGPGFRYRVTELAFHAGLVAGVAVGGAYLIANNPKPGRQNLSYARLFRFAVRPMIGAFALAPIVSPLICLWDPLGMTTDLADLLTPSQSHWLVAVWGINIGMYLGGCLGAIWGVVGIRRARAVMGAPRKLT
jgi:hypothetical protein